MAKREASQIDRPDALIAPASTSLRAFRHDERCRFRSLRGQGRRVVIRLTYRCDLACPHCLVGANLYRSEGELDLAAWSSILAELDRIQARKVLLTGGEPLLHPDLVGITAFVSSAGIPVDLNSNLQKMTPSLIQDLHRAGLTEISVSLEGPPEVHDRMHGTPGAWAKTVRAIRWAGEKGIQVDAACCVTPDNRPHLDELLAHVESLPIHSFTVSRMYPIGHGLAHLDRSVPQSELTALYHDLVERWVGRARIPIRLVGLLSCPQPSDCERGRSLIGITPRGHVVPCVLAIENPLGIPHPLEVGLAQAVEAANRELDAGAYQMCCP